MTREGDWAEVGLGAVTAQSALTSKSSLHSTLPGEV